MGNTILNRTTGEWLGPIPHDYEAKPEWLPDDAIVMVAFNPREHQVAMTWEFAEKRKAPARERDWAAVTAFCVEIPSVRRPTPAGDAVERAVMVCPQCEGEGGYPDGLDADACHTECTRCGGDGWIVDRAAIAAMGGAGWRPIETAPRDGTTIDVWRDGSRETVYWGFPPHCCGEMGQYCDSDWHRIKQPGWICSTFGEFVGGKHDPFTHWMPLPPAPEQEGNG